MNITKNIGQIALGYVIASIFIGPLLFAFMGSFAPGPIGDCFDDEWSKVPGAHSIFQRAGIIRHYELITQVGEGIMLAIGLIILALLIVGNSPDKRQSAFLLFSVLFMILGYAFAIWLLGNGSPCGPIVKA